MAIEKFFIDPHGPIYDEDNFFNLSDKYLNRDDGLLPFVRLKESLEKCGFEVQTFDQALQLDPKEVFGSHYISFGRNRSLDLLKSLKLNLYAYVIMEPPLIDNTPYENLPFLTSNFKNVFIHNTSGDCFSLDGVHKDVLKKFYWPQPHTHVLDKYWSNEDRVAEIIMINGHHRPKGFIGRERYSERIKWCLKLNKFIPVTIYGRGWGRLLSKASLWPLFILNYFKIKKIYKGACESKFAEMSRFDFALCFENLSMNGYITEKIFDCFYSGVIPIYWGGDDISTWIPSECFIDIRNFKNEIELSAYLKKISKEEKMQFKINGKKFIEGSKANLYFDLFKSLSLEEKFKG